MENQKFVDQKSLILNKLWAQQLAKGYISRSDIHVISQELGVSNTEIEGIISFYHFFHAKPAGHHTIYLNKSILSEFSGFHEVLKAFEEETGAKVGSVDPSGTFGLFETSCIGMSDQEPAALIDYHPFTNLTPNKVKKIVEGLKSRKPISDLVEPIFNNIREHLRDKSIFFSDYSRGEIIQKFIELNPDEIIEDLKHSGLSGRGGAFFPTGLKWQLCKNSFSKRKFIICNADEGEPGTFKDRLLLTERVGLLLEGMALAAYTANAYTGIIYLRAEYQYLKKAIENEIKHFQNSGLLGQNILGVRGFNFEVSVQLGAGAYICGEETALIESLEGKRGEPRTKTFFPVEKGYLYKPTIVNNVETFCAAARIIEKGALTFRELGTEHSSGSKLLSVAGDCMLPGIYEIEWGMTVRELLDLCGAKNTRYVQMSGPSGHLLTEKDFDIPISREGIMCGGSVMIFDDKRDIWQILLNFNQFFINESCGLCTPCRAGNYQIGLLLKKMRSNKDAKENHKSLRNWADLVQNTSRCGLGKTSNNFLLDVLDKCPETIIPQNKRRKRNQIEFDLEESLVDYSEFVNKIGRNG